MCGCRPPNGGDQHARRALVLDQVVAQRIDRILAALGGERADGAAGMLRQVGRDRDLHAVPRRDAAPVVEPVARDVGADALARLGSFEPLEHRRHAAGLHPLRHQILQRIAAGGIGIGIAVDVEAARLGGRDHVERARGLAPVVGARAFEVHDLDMHAACLGDGDRFLHRFQHLVRFVAEVSEVAGVVALEHAAERDHLVGLRIGAGRA